MTAATRPKVDTHTASVKASRTDAVRPYRAHCSCGWQSWSYVTELAADSMAAYHAKFPEETP